MSLPGAHGSVIRRDRWVCLYMELVGMPLGGTDGCVFIWNSWVCLKEQINVYLTKAHGRVFRRDR